MSRYGPTRSEWIFRLVFSLGGLGLMSVALLFHGISKGPAIFEVAVIGGGFFGGTAVLSGWKLLKAPKG